MKVSEADINEALALLEKHFPADRRDIWCKDNSNDGLAYTAYLASNDKIGAGSESGWGRTAVEAAEHLIARAGERDPVKLREKHISDLRKELAALEAEQVGTEAKTEAAEESVQA